MSDTVNAADLIVGNRYRLNIEDCCVEGQIEGVLLEIVSGGDGWRFDFGTIGGWALSFDEVT